MKISTRGRYALRLMTDVAAHDGKGFVSLKDVAERQDISLKYLEQIAGLLAKAGFPQSGRGAQGGYSLARAPHDIRVGEVFRALEGPLALASCISEANTDNCSRVDVCGSAFIWKEVQDAISAVLDKYSIGDLLDKEMGPCGGEQ